MNLSVRIVSQCIILHSLTIRIFSSPLFIIIRFVFPLHEVLLHFLTSFRCSHFALYTMYLSVQVISSSCICLLYYPVRQFLRYLWSTESVGALFRSDVTLLTFPDVSREASAFISKYSYSLRNVCMC